MKKKLTLTLALAVLLAAFMLAGCGTEPQQDNQSSTPESAAAQDLGEGSVIFSFEVTDDKGATQVYNIHTDETTVGAALLTVGLIEGDQTDFGLMVIYVNGQRADYNEDGAYWAFLIDGEFAAMGADATEIEQGRVYAFVYTQA